MDMNQQWLHGVSGTFHNGYITVMEHITTEGVVVCSITVMKYTAHYFFGGSSFSSISVALNIFACSRTVDTFLRVGSDRH